MYTYEYEFAAGKGFLSLSDLSLYPLSLYPLSLYPMSLYPMSLHPMSLYPMLLYPMLLYPMSLYPSFTAVGIFLCRTFSMFELTVGSSAQDNVL